MPIAYSFLMLSYENNPKTTEHIKIFGTEYCCRYGKKRLIVFYIRIKDIFYVGTFDIGICATNISNEEVT